METPAEFNKAEPQTTRECYLWRLPTEILDTIFELYFRDPGLGWNSDPISLHTNRLLYMLTALPSRGHFDKDESGSEYKWGYMGWENKFPTQLSVSVDWCRLGMRSWLKERDLFVSLDNIVLDDFARLKPKTWALFENVTLDISGSSNVWGTCKGVDIDDRLEAVFRACPRIEQLDLHGTDDLLDDLKHCLEWFPGEYGWCKDDEPRPTAEAMFGSLSWVGTLIEHEKLERVSIPPGELCNEPYDSGRDYLCWPTFPSAEMTGALEYLEDYVQEKLDEREELRTDLE